MTNRRPHSGSVPAQVIFGLGGVVVIKLLLWLLLFVACWPLAILALVLWPVVYILTLPLRVIGITVEAVFALLRALLFLPSRLLGHR